MNRFRTRAGGFAIGVVGLCLVSLAGGTVGFAQDSSATDAPARPNHIHEGSCDNLDPAPLYILNDLVLPDGDAQYGGEGSPAAVQTGVTTVDTSLADLVAGNFSINVHESADNIENYIACGEIGGVVVPGGTEGVETLAIGLRTLNDSGQSGIALFTGEGETTTVEIYLAEGLANGGEASASGADHGEHAAQPTDAVAVEIRDFLYSPDPVTVAAGESVTWTNQDAVPHTATGTDRDVLQTGAINAGESVTATFSVPGTFEYFCEFHPNMKGTLIVE